MARLNQTERKAMIRAFGIASAVFELIDLEFNGIPDSFTDKATFRSAHDLFIAGVEAKRAGRALTKRNRDSDTFMAGYRLAERGVVPAAAPEGAVIPNSSEPTPISPPFAVAAGSRTKWSAPHWIVRTGDRVELFEKKKGEWVCIAHKHTPPADGDPDWSLVMFEGTEWLIRPFVGEQDVIEEFAERLTENALDDPTVFDPNPEDHSQVAKLREQLAAGRQAFLDGAPSPTTLAGSIGYNVTREFVSRRKSS